MLDFGTNLLFGNPTYCLNIPVAQEFTSKCTKANQQYLNAKHEYLIKHQFPSHFVSLSAEWDPSAPGSLNCDFQYAGCFIAKTCKRKPKDAFVHKLANLCHQKNVLKCIITQICTSISMSIALAYHTRDGHQPRFCINALP